jgi:hypothetical protein
MPIALEMAQAIGMPISYSSKESKANVILGRGFSSDRYRCGSSGLWRNRGSVGWYSPDSVWNFPGAVPDQPDCRPKLASLIEARRMKPPFWEVTISRRAVAGREPTIESVNCFADLIAAEEYSQRALREDAALQSAVRYVEAIAPPGRVQGWINWVEEAKARDLRARVIQFREIS